MGLLHMCAVYDLMKSCLYTVFLSRKSILHQVNTTPCTVLIAAASRYGARGIGYELDGELAAAALSKVKRERVDHLVKIIRLV